MATKRSQRATKRVKNFAAKKVGSKRAAAVKGGRIAEMNVVKLIDKASPKLYEA